MSDMNVRSDAVDVEQIMKQIRARIREKRGADYTEAELQQLATVKLERFIDPKGLRSPLVQDFKKVHAAAPAPPNYEFGDTTLFETHRGPLAALRKLLRPILKLFFNPDRITSALHIQAQVNTQGEQRLRRLETREPLSYELLHNLTLEITRLGIEVHNLKMRVESLSSRVDFDERRAKALETVVQYRTPARTVPAEGRQTPTPVDRTVTPATPATPGAPTPPPSSGPSDANAQGDGERRRRRRRRRRRPGATMADERATNANDAGDDGPDDGPEADDTPGAGDQ